MWPGHGQVHVEEELHGPCFRVTGVKRSVREQSKPRHQSTQNAPSSICRMSKCVRVQSRWIAPTRWRNAKRTARRAKEAPPWCPWRSHRTCQTAPSITTRNRVQLRTAPTPTDRPGQPSRSSARRTYLRALQKGVRVSTLPATRQTGASQHRTAACAAPPGAAAPRTWAKKALQPRQP